MTGNKKNSALNNILIDMNKLCRLLCLVVVCFVATSYELYSQEADNTFSVSLQATTRGELRHGGFKSDSIDNSREANFVIGKYRLDFDYKRSWLELRLSPQQSGVWGQASGNLSLFEGWALVKSEKGFFAKIGRQLLAYDDERILGYDDWTMTAPTHDVLKFGYEGDRHKVHIILAYNQTANNPDEGNTYYANGLQPHKSMQTLWYHYDTPKSLFGASLLFMNIGMQSANEANPNTTFYQQLLGTYLSFKPKNWLLEGAFYYQMGKQEYGMTLDAFMGSTKVKHSFNDVFSLQAGYDYLSGDKYFAVPPHGGIGMVFHDKCRGFNPIYGSHHEFYGAMDFFYLDSYVGNFTPGLQNLYVGGVVKPTTSLELDLAYHYFAITSDLYYVPSKSLGHDIEFSASYSFSDLIKLSAGYSFLYGTKTMEILQKLDETRRMHWAWLMLTITPKTFTTTWQDKK